MADDLVEDRRVVRTRTALTQALMDLVTERDYDDITVGDIIAKAEVGRSTFYQHFQNKDDVFRALVTGGMEAMADTVVDGEQIRYLTDWLEIFWNNRRAGRLLLTGHTRQFLSRSLAELICERLERVAGSRPAPVHMRLVATQIAEGQIGMMHAWLSGLTAAPPPAVAEAMRLGAKGQVRALYGVG